MKYLKAVSVSIGCILLYMTAGNLMTLVVHDGALSTLIMDFALGTLFFVYYRKYVGDCRRSCSRGTVAGIFLLLSAAWLIVQVTGSVLMAVPGLSWFQYQNVEIDMSGYTLLTVIAAPIAEEVLFRGIVYRQLRTAFSPGVSLFSMALAFGLCHGNLPQLYIGTFGGLLFGYVYECTGRLWFSIVAHSFYNLLAVLLSGFGIPGWFLSPAVLIGGNMALLAAVMVLYLRVTRNSIWGGAVQDRACVPADGVRDVTAGEDAVLKDMEAGHENN